MGAVAGRSGEVRFGLRTGASANLYLHYAMNEGSGATITDTGSGGVNGTAANHDWILRSKRTGLPCVGFDGAASVIDSNQASPFGAADDLTLSAWVKLFQLPASIAVIIGDYDSGVPLGYWIGVDVTAGFNIQNGLDGSNYKRTRVNSTLNIGQWYFVAAVIFGDGSQPKLYVDGVEYTTTSNAGATGQLYQSASNIFAGRASNPAGLYWDGLLKDVRIYDRVLSQPEIIYLMLKHTDLQFATTALVAELDTWDITPLVDLEESTVMNGSTEAKRYEALLKGATGTMSGTLDAVANGVIDTEQERLIENQIEDNALMFVECIMDSGRRIVGPARMSNVRITANIGQMAKFSTNFTMDSQPVLITA